jgi:hypothetical protein
MKAEAQARQSKANGESITFPSSSWLKLTVLGNLEEGNVMDLPLALLLRAILYQLQEHQFKNSENIL